MTYPGALEACDGKDNNCSGGISALERDEDGDGQRPCEGDCDDFDPNVVQTTDVDADGVTVCDGDCADADPQRYPGNPEVDACDGIDHDCVPDPGEADADGDGALACAGDCRDDLAVVYPGADEVCDGWDNDCDGMRDDVPFTGSFPSGEVQLADVAGATLYGEVEGDWAGKWATGIGDMNADGYGDIAVSTWPDPNVVPGRQARTHIVYGPVCGEASLALEPDGVSGAVVLGLGDVSYVGDVNGDGFDDLRIGGLIFFGPLQGTLAFSDWDIGFSSWAAWQSHFSILHGPDLNGDGFADLVVGDYYGANVWDPVNEWWTGGGGRVAVWYGPFSAGVYDVEQPDALLLGPPGVIADFGWGLGSPGDLDGDGIDELIVGAPEYSSRLGAAHVYYGPLAGEIAVSEADAFILGALDDGVFGAAIAGIGDTDGDGLLEFAVGAPADHGGQDESAVYVFEGNVSGDLLATDAEAVFEEVTFASHFGAAMTGGADLDGDGRPDLVHTALWEDNGNPAAQGTVYIRGLGREDVRLTGGGGGGEESLDAHADINGDGVPDLVINAPGLLSEGVWTGGAYVVFGTPP